MKGKEKMRGKRGKEREKERERERERAIERKREIDEIEIQRERERKRKGERWRKKKREKEGGRGKKKERVHRYGPGGSIRACHAADRVRSLVGTNFLGEVFRSFSSPVRQMPGSFKAPRSPNTIWPSLSIIIHYWRQ